jgi:hypothetical protein
MYRLLAILVLLAPTALFAHPLDDDAEMEAELHILSDTHIELRMEFRYAEGIPSYTEFRNGLDANLDGYVTPQEVRRRFVELGDEMTQGIFLSVGDTPLVMYPDFSRFEFKDINNPDADLSEGLPTDTARIFYALVFVWQGPAPQPGEHTIELFFNAPQTLVYEPRRQLLVFDHRPSEDSGDRRLLSVDYTPVQGVFPAVRSPWVIAPPPLPAPTVQDANPDADSSEPASTTSLRPPLPGNLPPWMTLFIGGALVALGAGLGFTRVVRKRGSWMTTALFLLAGSAVIAGTLIATGTWPA